MPAGNLVPLVWALEVLNRKGWEWESLLGVGICWELSCPGAAPALSETRCESGAFVEVETWLWSFPFLSLWGRGSIGRCQGHCSVCLVPGSCTGEARARPGLGALLMCSFSPSVPQSFCATLGRRDGWEGKGPLSAVCPEKPSALGCAWHEQQVALGVAAMALLGLLCLAWALLC